MDTEVSPKLFIGIDVHKHQWRLSIFTTHCHQKRIQTYHKIWTDIAEVKNKAIGPADRRWANHPHGITLSIPDFFQSVLPAASQKVSNQACPPQEDQKPPRLNVGQAKQRNIAKK
ncbi:hypothetical protein ACFOSV_05245 [Algoriphagus namhaensis]|uniref:Transposase n=1 Tax=Algoriphagus namhaensis TaxID=915353 RepID=A0ABV8ANH3_9BACT